MAGPMVFENEAVAKSAAEFLKTLKLQPPQPSILFSEYVVEAAFNKIRAEMYACQKKSTTTAKSLYASSST